MRDTIPEAERQLTDLGLSNSEKLYLENSGCWATKDEEQEAIHIFAKDGAELYALSSKVIPYQPKPLFLTLQIYMIGYNNGRSVGQSETKKRLEKLLEFV